MRETADAVSLILRDRSGAPFPPVRPGQFFTLLLELDGRVLRRAYSASGDCRQREQVRLTIKRVSEGRVSNWLVDHAEAGMVVRVLGPSGEFGITPSPDAAPRKLVLIAGGSGVTPMMALLHTLPAIEPDAELVLIYGNRRAPDILFARELDQLVATYGPRVQVVHALEQPPEGWTGAVGRLDAAGLAPLIDGLRQPPAADGRLALAREPAAEFLLCGPTPMMEAARALLRELGIDEDRIHQESFFAPQSRDDATPRVREPQPVTIAIAGREVGLVVQPGQTLLEAGLAAGIAMPYSCTMGGCAACKVQLERGEIVMQEPNCLGPDERSAGWVLTCIGCPTRPTRVRVTGGR